MKEYYSIEEGWLHLVDPELELSYKEAFTPIRLPETLEGEVSLPNQRILKKDYNTEGELIRAYIEYKGVLDGEWRLFYPTGSKKMECYYNEGKLHGPSLFYSPEGKLLSQRWYIQGKQQGKSWWYYSTGKLYSLQQFCNGVWHGKQEYFYEDGTIKTLMHYHAGVLEGDVLQFAADGSLKRQLTYVNGQRCVAKDGDR